MFGGLLTVVDLTSLRLTDTAVVFGPFPFDVAIIMAVAPDQL